MTREELYEAEEKKVRRRLEGITTPQEFIAIFSWAMRENKLYAGTGSAASCAGMLLDLLPPEKRHIGVQATDTLAREYGRLWRYAGD